jgi:pimeloyl-ACP methyl ester carboxylesterase
MDSRVVSTKGGRTSVRVFEAGSGDPLLYLHGAGGIFPDDPFVATLARHLHVHAPLLPGFGDSEGAENLHGMLDVTLWGFDVADALGLSKPYLVGHSMGGMIAAEMAAVCPNDVERLALLAPVGLWLDDHPVPDLFALLPFELPELLFHDPKKGAKVLTAGFDFGDVHDAESLTALMMRFEDMGFLQQLMVDQARRLGMAGKLLFPIPDRGLRERLYRVKARTTLVWGDDDKVVGEPYARAFQSLLPEARLVRVQAAGHMLPYEQPDAVVAALDPAT